MSVLVYGHRFYNFFTTKFAHDKTVVSDVIKSRTIIASVGAKLVQTFS